MELKQQVTSLEISKRLKELGVKQDSLFWWDFRPKEGESKCDWHVLRESQLENKHLASSAFTVAELGKMLPFQISTIKTKKRWLCRMVFDNNPLRKEKGATYVEEESHTEADARGKMLIYLLENNLITL